MAHTATVTWKQNMQFDASLNGHTITMDTDIEVGGGNKGPRPKLMLLAGLGGCTGMDVIDILKKMRVEPSAFSMEISADLTEEHPKVYKYIKIKYIFTGSNLPLDKLEKAVKLSKEKYCGVSAMLSKTAEIEAEIEVINV